MVAKKTAPVDPDEQDLPYEQALEPEVWGRRSGKHAPLARPLSPAGSGSDPRRHVERERPIEPGHVWTQHVSPCSQGSPRRPQRPRQDLEALPGKGSVPANHLRLSQALPGRTSAGNARPV